MAADAGALGTRDPVMDSDETALQRRLGHHFRDPRLLRLALRHRSARAADGSDNERLEYLGDAVLGMLVADALYRAPTQFDEARLSVMRAALVRRETLADIGRALGLPDCLELGKGERRAGVGRRDSVLADAVEALVAAVYLDAGIVAAQHVVVGLLGDRLRETLGSGGERDAKSRLQEWLQARGLELPAYETVQRSGRDPDFVYHVACRVAAAPQLCFGIDNDVRAAEQKSAQAMLDLLGNSK